MEHEHEEHLDEDGHGIPRLRGVLDPEAKRVVGAGAAVLSAEHRGNQVGQIAQGQLRGGVVEENLEASPAHGEALVGEVV